MANALFKVVDAKPARIVFFEQKPFNGVRG